MSELEIPKFLKTLRPGDIVEFNSDETNSLHPFWSTVEVISVEKDGVVVKQLASSHKEHISKEFWHFEFPMLATGDWRVSTTRRFNQLLDTYYGLE